jgi:hypothetical protein
MTQPTLESALAYHKAKLPGWYYMLDECHLTVCARVCPDFNCPTNGQRLHKEIGEFEQGSNWDGGFEVEYCQPDNLASAWVEAVNMAFEALESRKRRASA